MKKCRFIYGLLSLLLMTSCYEDFIKDYDYSSVSFASQQPLRTVIDGRNMTIKVGAAIGGKRQVDKGDWASFSIKPDLLAETGLTILPESHYKLSDNNTFRVSNPNMPIVDVEIEFTEEFYNDPNSMKLHYALPFQLEETNSLDSILLNKEKSIVAIKYISAYHGEYYVKGTVTKLDEYGEPQGEPVRYYNADLSKNMLCSLTTVSRNQVCRSGVANSNKTDGGAKVLITVNSDNTLTLGTADGGIEITDGYGTYEYNYDDKNIESSMTMQVQYKYVKDGVTYFVDETLVRRQDPYRDLRFEEWE